MSSFVDSRTRSPSCVIHDVPELAREVAAIDGVRLVVVGPLIIGHCLSPIARLFLTLEADPVGMLSQSAGALMFFLRPAKHWRIHWRSSRTFGYVMVGVAGLEPV